MSTQVTPRELDLFAGLVARGLGFAVSNLSGVSLADVLASRAALHRFSGESYLGWLEENLFGPELRALASELTVSESYFFRDPNQLRAFTEVAVVERMRARAHERRLRILSAGCSSGEEPHSLAILLRESAPITAWDISICGMDVNPTALERAISGRYSAWALRATPAELRQRWFRPDGPHFVLDDAVRAAVTFREGNLLSTDLLFGQPHRYDVVFCRNVLMYLTPENGAALVARLTRALAPGGFLFLGHAETLRGLSADFELRNTHGTFYYQRPHPSVPQSRAEVRGGLWSPAHLIATRPHGGEADLAWMSAVAGASMRIRALSARAPLAAATASLGKPESAPARPDLTEPLALLRAERFAESLDALSALPPEAGGREETLVLRAVLLAASGRFDSAEDVCRKVLNTDRRNAGAHYILASCRDAVGDEHGASEHSRLAAHLDPGFAMPRLHLGLLARQAGHREAARREFSQALTLLPREEAARILLYGGGFNRAALVKLCRAELLSCGGTP